MFSTNSVEHFLSQHLLHISCAEWLDVLGLFLFAFNPFNNSRQFWSSLIIFETKLIILYYKVFSSLQRQCNRLWQLKANCFDQALLGLTVPLEQLSLIEPIWFFSLKSFSSTKKYSSFLIYCFGFSINDGLKCTNQFCSFDTLYLI